MVIILSLERQPRARRLAACPSEFVASRRPLLSLCFCHAMIPSQWASTRRTKFFDRLESGALGPVAPPVALSHC
jgi:hypothetical protein